MTTRDRIDQVFEGALPPAEAEVLRQDVVGDGAVRTAYVEAAWLHGQLCAERDRLPRLLEEAGEATPRLFYRVPQLGWAMAAIFAVSLLVLGLLGWSRQEETVAVLVEASGCRWGGSDLPTVPGAKLGKGRLTLVEGMAGLRFRSGAEVTLEAPTTLELLSSMRCRLVEGSVVAEVPERAHGFTIDAPAMEVVDLGTRFGVTASSLGSSQVVVFQGEVEVEQKGEDRKRLTTGKSLHLGLAAPGAGDELVRDPLPAPREDGVLLLSTSVGRGMDAYVRKGDAHGSTGAQPLLMVKETSLVGTNRRRAYIAFDLTTLAGMELAAAQLSLESCQSGLGFSALVPDSRFAVYGISQGDWTEDDLRWGNAPATAGDELDDGALERLGGFEICRGSANGLVTVASRELLEFLRRHQGGMASLLLVRETGETEPQGLVHAFASKEHPTAQPPTLRLQIENKQ